MKVGQTTSRHTHAWHSREEFDSRREKEQERRLGVHRTHMDLGNSRFVMKVYCMFCLDPSASFEPVPVGVLVKSGFGRDDGSGATKLISVLNEEHRQPLFLEGREGGMAGFQLVFVTRTRRRHAHVREGELEGIIHFELFVGVEHGAHLLQKGVHPHPSSKPLVGCQTTIIVSVG